MTNIVVYLPVERGDATATMTSLEIADLGNSFMEGDACRLVLSGLSHCIHLKQLVF